MKNNESDTLKLEELNQGLLERVATLEANLDVSSVDLELANKRLVRLEGERSAFVSAISHELKTPLTGLKLFAGLLLSDESGVAESDRTRYLEIISSEADRLSHLISTVAEFQKICSGDVHWHDEVIDVVKILERLARSFSVLCESKGIEFSCQFEIESLSVVFDKERLVRVVYNMLSNALKFTRQGSIKLGLKMNPAADGFCLSVSDTGLGMSNDQLRKIFMDDADAPVLGKGLGLFVSKHIVAHYQGRIWAESVVDKGSVFYVALPLSDAENDDG